VQSASPAHARQECVVRSHTGVVPPQSESPAHATHVALVVSQAGVRPPHFVLFVAEHTPQAPEGSHAGVAAPQSTSAAHGRQVCVTRLHVGAVPLQSALELQATQVPVVGSHAGVVAPHLVLFVAEHTPHAPEGSQAGAMPPHSPSPVQPRHVCVVASHTGVVPEHCAAERHPTHEPVTALQTGTVPMHCLTFVTEHAPHEPLGWQAGVEPPQSASLAQGRHVCAVRSQAGVDPPQFAFDVHATQVAVAASQAGVAPEHSATFVVEHAPHAPEASHAGFAPLQSASDPQARHVCVPWSHAGLVPPQSALTTQATQAAVEGLQTGVVPPHFVVFVGEHTPHVPFGSQAGVDAGHSASLWHPRQTWVVVLHTGVAPLQVALPTQATQVPAAVSQEGVAPEHFAVFVAEHAPHEPLD
jgi:hypothetical protein